jgi:hypothetical protein
MKVVTVLFLVVVSAFAPAQDLKELLTGLASEGANRLVSNVVGQSIDRLLDDELNRGNRSLNKDAGHVDLAEGSVVCFSIHENESNYSDSQILQGIKTQVKFWGKGLKIGADFRRGDELPSAVGSRPHIYVRITARSANGFSALSADTRRLFNGISARLYGEKDFAEVGIQLVERDENGEELTDADSGVFNVVGADAGRKDTDIYVRGLGDYSESRGNNLSGEMRDAFCRLTATMTGRDPRDQKK